MIVEHKIPAALDRLLLSGFILQAKRDKADKEFKVVKEQVEKLKVIKMGESLPCEYGQVQNQAKLSWEYDRAKLKKLVESGTVSLDTLLNIASFSADKLKSVIGEKEFLKVATSESNPCLVFRASQDFKNLNVESGE